MEPGTSADDRADARDATSMRPGGRAQPGQRASEDRVAPPRWRLLPQGDGSWRGDAVGSWFRSVTALQRGLGVSLEAHVFRAEQGPRSRRRDARTTTKAGPQLRERLRQRGPDRAPNPTLVLARRSRVPAVWPLFLRWHASSVVPCLMSAHHKGLVKSVSVRGIELAWRRGAL